MNSSIKINESLNELFNSPEQIPGIINVASDGIVGIAIVIVMQILFLIIFMKTGGKYALSFPKALTLSSFLTMIGSLIFWEWGWITSLSTIILPIFIMVVGITLLLVQKSKNG